MEWSPRHGSTAAKASLISNSPASQPTNLIDIVGGVLVSEETWPFEEKADGGMFSDFAIKLRRWLCGFTSLQLRVLWL